MGNSWKEHGQRKYKRFMPVEPSARGPARPLRIHFVGNTCNNHYVLAKGLRGMGVDARLYFTSLDHPQNDPKSEDPDLAVGYPDWICRVDVKQSPTNPMYNISPEMIGKISDCNLL